MKSSKIISICKNSENKFTFIISSFSKIAENLSTFSIRSLNWGSLATGKEFSLDDEDSWKKDQFEFIFHKNQSFATFNLTKTLKT